MPPPAAHFVNRAGWLRAAVLGANDGIISTASLIVGVASAGAPRGEILTAAVAGWAAGAMAMAAGEYVSVSSQADSEAADLERERRALAGRTGRRDAGADADLSAARPGARAGARGRGAIDGRGRPERARARRTRPFRRQGANPILAAFASAISFSMGAAMPTLAAFAASREATVGAVSLAALAFLAALGALGAWMGGASIVKPTLRVAFWGALAMAVTAGIGALIGKAV